MNPQDIEKLLGGFGAGILTPEEERALFAAALEDQALFDALAREQPLRDLLGDPAARASLLAALEERPLPWHRRMADWATAPRALAALVGILCVALPLAVWEAGHRRPAPVETARMAPMEAPSRSIVPEAAPAPPVPKARAAAAVKRKPKTEEPLEVGAAETAQLAEIAPVAKKLAPEGERKAGAAGTVSGAPQTLGQLTPGRQQGYGRLVPAAPAPAAAPSAPQAQAAASLGALAPVSPLQWSLLRRQSGGEFVAADAGDLQAGDAVRLRLESKDAGYVYVVEKEAVLASSRVEAGKPFDAAIESHGPGRRDLALWFSPYPMAWPTTGQAQMGAFRASAGAQSGNGVRAEDAVRAPAGSGGAASARPVAIAITLNYQ